MEVSTLLYFRFDIVVVLIYFETLFRNSRDLEKVPSSTWDLDVKVLGGLGP